MDFAKGRLISKLLLFSGSILLVVSLVLEEEFPGAATFMMWVALLVFFCGVVATIVLCRCPYCKKILIVGALTKKECPRCRKPLVSKSEQLGRKLSERDR